jgi:hypothetical protein
MRLAYAGGRRSRGAHVWGTGRERGLGVRLARNIHGGGTEAGLRVIEVGVARVALYTPTERKRHFFGKMGRALLETACKYGDRRQRK